MEVPHWRCSESDGLALLGPRRAAAATRPSEALFASRPAWPTMPSDTDASPLTCQSPFWKKFREALVINPESTSGNPVSLLCLDSPDWLWCVCAACSRD